MLTSDDGVLLRVFCGEDDKFGYLSLYEAIVHKAIEMHIAGATVMRGPLGFGHSSLIHRTKMLRLSTDLPLVIEIIDRQDKIDALLPELDRLIPGGLVTIEKIKILRYGQM